MALQLDLAYPIDRLARLIRWRMIRQDSEVATSVEAMDSIRCEIDRQRQLELARFAQRELVIGGGARSRTWWIRPSRIPGASHPSKIAGIPTVSPEAAKPTTSAVDLLRRDSTHGGEPPCFPQEASDVD
jgi:hypothetical protein